MFITLTKREENTKIRVNIHHVSSYFDRFPGQEDAFAVLVHHDSSVLHVNETSEQIDKMIRRANTTIEYTF